MKAHKYFDGMADQNKLFLGIPVNCMVCGLLCVKKDRLFVNPDDGQIIHYDCFVFLLTRLQSGLNDN